MSVNVGAQHGVHSRKMTFALRLEPTDNIGVEP